MLYIPEEDILHSHQRETLKSYIALTDWVLERRINVPPVRYELGFFISQKMTFFLVTAMKTSDVT
jgi:hypothetical protein